MKKKLLLLILSISFAIMSVFGLTLVFAYYEYKTTYSSIINVNGRIKADAFDALYENFKNSDTYGVTPENPFVIDSYDRLMNLVTLNNSGKLNQSRVTSDTKYYFALNFDHQEADENQNEQIAQLLNLASKDPIEPIGNEANPFRDEFSGILYAYPYTYTSGIYNGTTEYVYYSGCAEKYTVTYNESESKWYIDDEPSTLDFSVKGGEGTYIRINKYADTIINNELVMTFQGESVIDYINLADPQLKVVHQMIANAHIQAPSDQMDIGFFGTISAIGNVHDVILYNTSIDCVNTTGASAHDTLLSIWESLSGSHPNFAYEDKHDERHVGLFAGHIEGAAADISLAGESTITIGTPSVNYYSAYVSVGYIAPTAIIGGALFSDVIQDYNTDNGSISGSMFADFIYECTPGEQGSYVLAEIESETGKWPGVVSNKYFTYGSFNFVMSSQADVVTSIWAGQGELYFLNKAGYAVNGSVLYCKSEYRYSDSAEGGGSLSSGSASSNESMYSGISTLASSISMFDKGKYVITAKVPKIENAENDDDYNYFALKIVAQINPNTGIVEYIFDTSEKVDVTNYILNIGESSNIYSSAMWEVKADSETPSFVNCRFDSEYLLSNDSNVLSLTQVAQDASHFDVDVISHTFSYTKTENNAVVKYYLNYRNDGTDETPVHTFYFSTQKNTIINVYMVSNGFNTMLITSTDDLEQNSDYIIVGKNNGNNYLLGVGLDGEFVTSNFAIDYAEFASEIPTQISLATYNSIKNYVWYAKTVNSAQISFREKVSGAYYISNDAGELALTKNESNFTYNEGTSAEGGSLSIGAYFLKYTYTANSKVTGFSLNGSQNFDIFLYKLIPDDDDPPFITYDGAKYLESESTPLNGGEYMVIAHSGNNYYALRNNSGTIGYRQGTFSNDPNSGVIFSVSNDDIKWTVTVDEDETLTSEPTFKNGTYYITSASNPTGNNTVNTSLSTTSKIWAYDATNYNVYYKVQTGSHTEGEGDDEVTIIDYTYYYLLWDTSSSSFKVTSGKLDNNNYCYIIELYSCSSYFTYSGITEITQEENNNTGFNRNHTTEVNTQIGATGSGITAYMVLTNPLVDVGSVNDETPQSYALGVAIGEDESHNETRNLTSLNISTSISYNASQSKIISTKDLAFYMWYYISANTNTANAAAPHQFYNKGYRDNGTSSSMVYLAASSSGGQRVTTLSLESNAYNTNVNTGKSITGFYFYKNGNGTNQYNGYLGFRGGSNTYVMQTTNTPGETVLYSSGFSSANRIYVYKVVGITETKVSYLISSDGDTLDDDIHYMIVARANDSYYALSRTVDEDTGDVVLYSENVKSQAINIISNGTLKENIMVPVNSDWTQISTSSSDNELSFYHTSSSSNELRNFLDYVSSSITTTGVQTGNTNSTTKWYYEIASQRLKFKVNSTWYYITFDSTHRTFGTSTNASQAAEILLFRFTPSYSVVSVDSFDDEMLKTGSFIIAGKSVDGYNALGISAKSDNPISMNVTSYLRSHLTEEEYNTIINHIFNQLFYSYDAGHQVKRVDFTNDTYEGNTNNGYIYFDPLSEVGYGSFQVTSSNLQKSTGGTIWKVTPVLDGDEVIGYRFINATPQGTTVNANSRYISYTNNASASLTVSGSYSGDGEYIGELYEQRSFGSGSDIKLYSLQGNVQTTISSGNSYNIRFTYNGNDYIVGNNNGTAIISDYSTELVNNESYIWTSTTFISQVVLKNGDYYVGANNSYQLVLSTTVPYICSVNASGVMSFKTFNFPRYDGGFVVSNEPSENYNMHLYSVSRSGNTHTYTKVTNPTNSTTYAVLYNNNGTYYLIRVRNTLARYTNATGSMSGSNVVISSNTNLTGAGYTVTYTNGMIRSRNNTTYYLTLSDTAVNVATTGTTFTIDSTYGIYTVSSNAYTARASVNVYSTISSSNTLESVYIYKYSNNTYENSPYSNSFVANESYAIIIKENGTYYLLNYGASGSELTFINIGSQIDLSSYTGTQYRVTAVSGTLGMRLRTSGNYYLYKNSNYLGLTTTANSAIEFKYYFNGQTGDGSTLRTQVSGSVSSTKITASNGSMSEVGYTTTATNYTYLYEVINDSGNYYLGNVKTSSGLTSGNNYAVVLVTNTANYIVTKNSSGDVYAVQVQSLVDCALSYNQVWTADGNDLTTTIGNTTYYLNVGENHLMLGTTDTTTWSYTFTAGTPSFSTATSGTTLHIFKINKNDELDKVTDIETSLGSKMQVTASVVALQSNSEFVITSAVNGKYYALTMKTINEAVAVDITDMVDDGFDNTSTVTLFDSTVWTQSGSKYSIIPENNGFMDNNLHYLTAILLNKLKPIVSDIDQNDITAEYDYSNYTWRTYKTGNYELFGLSTIDENTSEEVVYYLYFDSTNLEFKLTTNVTTATNGLVQLYQLGRDVSTNLSFITVKLSLASDGVTITNYPLELVDADEIVEYSETVVDNETVVQGEYVIIVEENNSHYALTYNSQDELSFVDVMLYFTGNYSKDDNDDFCFSINEKYIWKQTSANPSTSLTFKNLSTNTDLSISGSTSLHYTNNQLSDGSGHYLGFSVAGGYEILNSTPSSQILIYEVGAHGVAATDPISDLSYTYYHSALSTDANGSDVSFSNFDFEHKLITELLNYKYDSTTSQLQTTVGWTKSGSATLTTVNSSVYFKNGVNYNRETNTVAASEFSEFTYTYTSSDNMDHDITYYIPNGVVGFVVPYASSDEPVLINIIATTEFDTNNASDFEENYLRYLALWKVATIDENYAAIPTSGGSANATNFASSLSQSFDKPFAAIPLPNHYGSVESGASKVCVDENGVYHDYNLVNLNETGQGETVSHDHLIAHTFCVSAPGVYYLGSTYGSFAISYVSIDNLYTAEVGEESGTSVSDNFTIDFVWGSYDENAPTCNSYVVSRDCDLVLGTIGYVRHVGTNTVVGNTITDPTYVHSNIFPYFTSGTKGLVDPIPSERSETYNPTDSLVLTVTRTFTYDASVSETQAISTVAITGMANAYIYNHDGIKYLNDNNMQQRRTRLVTYNITTYGE